MEDAREARRRKLLSRGSDRLAFITGQSRSLPKPDPPSQLLSAGSNVSAKIVEPPEINAASIEAMTEEPTVVSPTNKVTSLVSSSRAGQNIGSTETVEKKINNNSNAVLKATCIFTLKEISNSISTTENIRMMSSVIIALFAVIFHHGFLLSVKFRPLVLVVLTDLTIIFGSILRNRVEESRRRVLDVNSGIIDLGKVIEGAILFKKAMAAVSMDCSVCAVIMICAVAV